MSSGYPAAIDALTTSLVDGTDAGDETPGSTNVGTHAAHHNNLADAVNKIEGELGTNPKGAAASVKARLDTLDTTVAAKQDVLTVQDEGSSLTNRSTVNFVGAGVTATDAGGKTVVTIPGGGSAPAVQTPAYAATVTPDASLGDTIKVGALTGNITIGAPTNGVAGQSLRFIFIQDATGGRTVTWNAAFLVPDWNPALGPSKVTTIEFIYDGTNWRQLSQTGATKPWFLNVMDFGAVCDAVTDDSAAVQRAIDSFWPNTSGHGSTWKKGVIFFPTGDKSYLLNTGVTLNAGGATSTPAITFLGYGAEIYTDATNAGAPVINVTNSVASSTDTSFTGIKFFCNVARTVIKGKLCENVRITHCRFIGAAALGVHLLAGDTSVGNTIAHCFFDNLSRGILLEGGDWTSIVNNQFTEQVALNWIEVTGSINHLLIEGNQFYGDQATLPLVRLYYSTGSANNVVISGNTFNYCKSLACISLFRTGYSDNIVISGNVFRDSFYSDIIWDGSNRVNITGNVFGRRHYWRYPTTVTVTIATPGVFTFGGSSAPSDGDKVRFSTSGALPTGITAGTTYYVRDTGVDGAGKFRIAATAGGSAINTSGTQSGTHKLMSGYSVIVGTNAGGASYPGRDSVIADNTFEDGQTNSLGTVPYMIELNAGYQGLNIHDNVGDLSILADHGTNIVRNNGRPTSTYVLMNSDANFTTTAHQGRGFVHVSVNTVLSTTRTVDGTGTGSHIGDVMKVTHNAGSGSSANVNGLKTIAPGQWCETVFDGSAWRLVAFGSL